MEGAYAAKLEESDSAAAAAAGGPTYAVDLEADDDDEEYHAEPDYSAESEESDPDAPMVRQEYRLEEMKGGR